MVLGSAVRHRRMSPALTDFVVAMAVRVSPDDIDKALHHLYNPGETVLSEVVGRWS